MPIEVYTGKPGNGKTALMMERLHAEAEKAERPIYAAGIEGLQPGLATELGDPRQWNDIDPDGNPVCTCDKHPEPHAHMLPNGALCFIDEAWKWFGHLHDASRQATPPHVLALAEHRHRGIDFIWTTQGPNQLYPFSRPLIADHYHVVRRFGTQMIEVYKWEELQEDIKSPSKREAAIRTTRSLPKAVFGSYKSADAHTIKAKVPLRVWVLPLLLLAAVGLVWGAFAMLRPATAGETAEGGASGLPDARPDSDPPPAASTGTRRRTYATAADYLEAHQPRMNSLPWSAPIFDGRGITADPLLFCIEAGAGHDAQGNAQEGRLHCVTEQGTPYKLPEAEARHVARWGAPYNPYRQRAENMQQDPNRDQGDRTAAAPTATALRSAQVNGYGDLGITANPGP